MKGFVIMKKRLLLCMLAAGMLTSCGSAASSDKSSGAESSHADRETIFQVSLLQGLTLGDYYGSITANDLKQRGDTGIGTFEGVNGELIMADGTVYRALSDGSVEIAPDDETIPFANVTFFDTDEKQDIGDISDIDALKGVLDEKVKKLGKNRFYMVRIDGVFKNVHARSELKQNEPYKPLAEALKTDQREFKWDNIEGTVVALYCPQYMNDLNAVGWHMHFISSDKSKGGHLLDIDIDSAELKIDCTQGFNMLLPETKMFPDLDLTVDQSEDIKNVETK